MSDPHPLRVGESEAARALAGVARRVAVDLYPPRGARAPAAHCWGTFVDLGWPGACLPESLGGLGLPLSVCSVLAETLAPAVMTEPLFSQLAHAGHLLSLARPGATREALLERWLAGATQPLLVHAAPEVAPWAEWAPLFTAPEGGGLEGAHPLVADAAGADVLLVAAGPPGSVRPESVWVVDPQAPGVAVERTTAIDGRVCLALRVRTSQSFPRLDFADPAGALAEASWLYALMLASESLGLMRCLTQRTQEHLVQREQFGHRLIDFQALQHRLVDMLRQVLRVEALLEVARLQVDTLGLLAAAPWIAAAKAAAGEESRRLGREAVQMHGAIGLTAEFGVGAMLRRLVANELLAGTTAQHAACWETMRPGGAG